MTTKNLGEIRGDSPITPDALGMMTANTMLGRYGTDGPPQAVPCKAVGRSLLALDALDPSLAIVNGALGVPAVRQGDYRKTAQGLSLAATGDICVFTGLPAYWRLRMLSSGKSSGTASTAAVRLFSAAGGGGTPITPIVSLVLNLTTSLSFDYTMTDRTRDVFNFPNVYLRCTTANLTALTAWWRLEVEDWS